MQDEGGNRWAKLVEVILFRFYYKIEKWRLYRIGRSYSILERITNFLDKSMIRKKVIKAGF